MIEAWSDDFAALRRDIEIKQRARVDLEIEIEEARIIIEQAAAGADGPEPVAGIEVGFVIEIGA